MFVRVVLDTCTVRKHISNRTPRIDLNLVKQKREQVRLSLSASAFVELTRQLVGGDVPFADWQACVPTFNDVLDQRWPFIPNGKQLAWLAGTQQVDPIESVEDESRHLRACWDHLCTVKPEEMGKRQVNYCASDGTRMRIRFDQNKLNEVVAGQRQDWIDYIRKMQTQLPNFGITASNTDKIVDMMRSDFGSDPKDAPGVAAKLDTFLQMLARFVSRSLNTKSAYNPESDKNRGDTFDLNLLFYIPLPAVIVTGDDRFLRGLRETDAAQLGQVLSIEEFNEHLGNDTLASLVSEFQTPARQFQSHREAAYLRWENRNRPASDDWKDWFESEPIA